MQRINSADWTKLAQGQFDAPRQFGAYCHTLRWNSVTSSARQLFQAPYRPSIRIDAYQLEPLRNRALGGDTDSPCQSQWFPLAANRHRLREERIANGFPVQAQHKTGTRPTSKSQQAGGIP
jgi:hypothetical protein